MNLYEINQNFKNLEEVLENSDDENLLEIINASMEELNETFESKVENIVKYCRNLKGQAEVFDGEIKRLTDRKKSLEKKVENLEKYLFDAMKFANKEKINTKLFEVSIKKNPYSVKITDDFAIDEKYLIKTEKITVDKKRIKEDILHEVEVKGAILERKLVLKVR